MDIISPQIIYATNGSNGMIAESDECHCACAHTPRADFSYTDLTGSWQAARAQTFPMPNGWQGLFSPGSSIPLTVLNQPAYNLWTRFQQTQVIGTLDLDKEEIQAVLDMASAGLLQLPT